MFRRAYRKYIVYSLPIEKELHNGKTSKWKKKKEIIDSFRFMSTSLSSLVDSCSNGLYNDKCTDSKSYFDYMLPEDDQLIFRRSKCKKNSIKISLKDL